MAGQNKLAIRSSAGLGSKPNDAKELHEPRSNPDPQIDSQKRASHDLDAVFDED
jgi:hypothetical protein